MLRQPVSLLSILIVVGIAGFASNWVVAEDPAAVTKRPNVLLIVADDLGWSDVGWHGGFSKTPHMDQLVKTGVELDQHYVQPVCTPTRTALMSGRYPGRFGPHALSPSNLRAMPMGTVTLALALQSLGYTTVQTGKWHLGAKPEWGPNAFGFQHGYGTLTGAADPWTHKYRRGPYEDTWHRDGKLFNEEGNATELVAAEAVKRIEQAQGPWFVYVPFHAVHTPVDAPAEFKKLYDGVKFSDDPEKQDSRLRMAAMVSQLDAKIGQFVAALEKTKQERENTLIIFTSDNGGIESLKNAYVGEVGHSPLNSENDPLRGQKNTLYEGGTRVCAFAHWPGKLRAHKQVAPMHAVDWFPTICGLVGYQPTTDLKWDGVDQWDAISGKKVQPIDRVIYIAHGSGDASLRHREWKLISRKSGKLELFNIAADPYEKDDLAAKETDRVAELSKRLAAERAKDEAKLPADLVGQPK